MSQPVHCKSFLLSVFLFAMLATRAQDEGLRSLFVQDSLYKTSVLKAIEAKYKEDADGATGEHKKYIREIYKERYDYIKGNFDINAILTDPSAVAYINGLTRKILANNPALQKLNPRVLLYKAWWPNASSMGEGTVYVNIGIVYKFLNEAQLAFVLCHELAHLYLNHGNIAINKYVNTVYDDEFQKELKKIAKQSYEKNKRLKELEKTIAFSSKRHSREKESEADSMALEFMKNTEFDIREAKTALAMLDSIDQDKYNIEPPLQKYFNDQAFPFKSSWVKEEEAFFGGATATIKDKKLLDSLKTHPDCSQRIIQVTPAVDRYTKAGSVLDADEAAFKAWKQKFDFEVIAFAYDRENISLAMYQALQTLEQYPHDSWLLAMVGNCLIKMYEAQKKHELNRYVELPSPYHEKKYNGFLQFIQNLSLADIAGIGYYFMEDNRQAGIKNEHFVYALIKSKEYFNKPAEKQEWINYYKTNFNKPSYKF
jgi:chaperonin cofactor prefoldin